MQQKDTDGDYLYLKLPVFALTFLKLPITDPCLLKFDYKILH